MENTETTAPWLAITISEEHVRDGVTGKILGVRRKMTSGDRTLCEVYVCRDSRLWHVDLCSILNDTLRSVGYTADLVKERQKATHVTNSRSYLFSLFGKEWFGFFKFRK